MSDGCSAGGSDGSGMDLNGVAIPMIPYGRQEVDDDDIAAVVDVLKSDWLTTGPKVTEFEVAVADYVGASHAVAVNSGTAALHAMMAALEIGPGDEVIVPAITFASTANCVVFQGATPVFADVDPATLLICPNSVAEKITDQTRAIIAVDYAGQPCDYTRLQVLASQNDICLLTDGCHSLGARYKGTAAGSVTEMTAFSFHPVKPITTGEGGMVTTSCSDLAAAMRQFRNHGIVTDARQREASGTWFYEMQSLGYNYRISDIQCALGLQQLSKLDGWRDRREQIADLYDDAFRNENSILPLSRSAETRHGWHLYVVRLQNQPRNAVFDSMRAAGIGVNVHYIPVHLHPYYRNRFGTAQGDCPNAEAAYEQILSLPIYPGMTDQQVQFVVSQLSQAAIQSQKAA